MGSGISLYFLALGTIGGVGLLALAARKQVADLKGDQNVPISTKITAARTTAEHAGYRALKPRPSRLRHFPTELRLRHLIGRRSGGGCRLNAKHARRIYLYPMSMPERLRQAVANVLDNEQIDGTAAKDSRNLVMSWSVAGTDPRADR